MWTSRKWVFLPALLAMPFASICTYARADATPEPPPSNAVGDPAGRVFSLAEIERIALAQQPQMLVAHAQTRIAEAGADLARSPLLPQVTGLAQYTRETGNFAPRPGAVPGGTTVTNAAGQMFTITEAAPTTSLTQTYDYWNFGLTGTQLIYDFGQTYDKYRSARETQEAQRATEDATRFVVLSTVRGAYFAARSNKDLIEVARENVADQEKHLTQVQGFVDVGTQPMIALAQQKSALATARVQFVTAQNNYEISKAQLNQAAGMRGGTNYDLSDEGLGPVAGEDEPLTSLLTEALKTRPEMASFTKQRAAQEDSISAAKGSYGPAFSAAAGLTAAGTSLTGLVPNWNAGLILSWPIFQGGLTVAEVHQAQATLSSVEAMAESELLQIQVQVDTARLAVRGAKASLGAAEDALTNAREQLRLAEQRYSTGVGSIIELNDAQVARTTAAAQLVQARYGVASARAQLLAALGRP
jgi:outer membrane protein